MLSRNTTKKSSGSGAYSASIKESGPVPLSLGTSLLPICLEQEYHEGEKLNAIFHLLQQSQKIAVLVSGSLYRHTIQLSESLTPKEAFEKARQRGQEWEDTYGSMINETSKKTCIVIYKWDVLLLDEKYPSIRKQLEKYYLDKIEFKQAFDHEANLFIERLLKKKCKIEDREKSLSLCLDYLIEECAVFVLMNNSFVRYTHFVYPGPASKAIQASFDCYKLKISIVRPEFAPIKVRSAEYIDLPLNQEEIWQKIHDLDEKAKFFADMRGVFSNCKIFCLKKAASNIRHRVAMQIDAHVMPHENNLVLYKTLTIKYDVLIYAPKNKYPINKFDSESSKKYIPSREIDYRALTSSSQATFPTCGFIDLRPLENEEVKKCELIMSFIETRQDDIFKLEASLKDICETTVFIYSYLVYHVSAPEAKFDIIGNDVMSCKLYYSSIDGAADKDDAILKITEYFLKLPDLDSNFPNTLLETKIEDALEERSGVHISDPIILVKPLFKFFKSLRENQNIDSAPFSLSHSASSTQFGSPLPSVMGSCGSMNSPRFGSPLPSVMGSYSSMDSVRFEQGNFTDDAIVSDGTTSGPMLFSKSKDARDYLDKVQISSTRNEDPAVIMITKKQNSDSPNFENQGVQTGLFFTPKRSCAIKFLAPVVTIGVGLALQAYYFRESNLTPS